MIRFGGWYYNIEIITRIWQKRKTWNLFCNSERINNSNSVNFSSNAMRNEVFKWLIIEWVIFKYCLNLKILLNIVYLKNIFAAGAQGLHPSTHLALVLSVDTIAMHSRRLVSPQGFYIFEYEICTPHCLCLLHQILLLLLAICVRNKM